MKLPRRTVGKIALFLVILTVGLTSPLLTMLSTLLLPKAAADPVLSSQIISLLGGHWGGQLLQTEVAISASALLVFASNTAIIGSYHVFLALSRMEFFPQFILRRNKLRGTPHYSIALATIVPILVLVIVRGNINILGDMYAFGLLGAFSLTCLGMDIVRYRGRKARRKQAAARGNTGSHARRPISSSSTQGQTGEQGASDEDIDAQAAGEEAEEQQTNPAERPEPEGPWTRSTLNFYLGILTTILVLTAWSTNLVAKPLATAFGGSVSLLGMIIAYTSYRLHRRKGRAPVVTTGVEWNFPGAVLAVLSDGREHNKPIVEAALNNPGKKPVVFLFLGNRSSGRKPELFRLIEPHLNDEQARKELGRVNYLAQEAKIDCRFVYRHQEPGAAYRVWEELHPADTIVAPQDVAELKQINPDRIEEEVTPDGKMVHLLKEHAT
jgi:positive regulator of sigma E activity